VSRCKHHKTRQLNGSNRIWFWCEECGALKSHFVRWEYKNCGGAMIPEPIVLSKTGWDKPAALKGGES
jgi:hypothetical protein